MQAVKEAGAWPLSVARQSRLQEAIHERGWGERERVVRALAGGVYPTLVRWAQQMAGCAQTVRFYVDPELGRVNPWIQRCKHRLCPWCARARTVKVAGQIEDALKSFRRPRMMVLTVQSDGRPLSDQLGTLRAAFRRLRRLAEWRKRVVGGVYTVEVTLNLDTRRWHPHVHVVYAGEYFPQGLLSTLWHQVTGGSEIVWIADVHDRHGAAVELAKYLGKPAHLKAFSDAEICEYARATAGSRMAQTFGKYRRLAVSDDVEVRKPGPDAFTLSLPRVMHLARYGHVVALRLVELVAERWPVFASYIYHWAPQISPPPNQADKVRRLMALSRSERGPPDVVRPGSATDPHLDAKIFAAFTSIRIEEERGSLVDYDRREVLE